MNTKGRITEGCYLGGKVDWFDLVDVDKMSMPELKEMMLDLGISQDVEYFWLVSEKEFSSGLRPIKTDEYVSTMCEEAKSEVVTMLYVQEAAMAEKDEKLTELSFDDDSSSVERYKERLNEDDDESDWSFQDYDFIDDEFAPKKNVKIRESSPQKQGQSMLSKKRCRGEESSQRNRKVDEVEYEDDDGDMRYGSESELLVETKLRLEVWELEKKKKDKNGMEITVMTKVGQKGKCSICKQFGHNKRKHAKEASASNSTTENQSSQPAENHTSSLAATPSAVQFSLPAATTSAVTEDGHKGYNFMPTPGANIRRKLSVTRGGHTP
ncbi:hypothetical protein LINPERHAP1_LOCUS609 [Linum perenne]